METRIQYAKTSDGVDIAFTTYGDGPPIVIPPNIMNSHLQLELTNPLLAGFFQRLSTRLRVVRYDRGPLADTQRQEGGHRLRPRLLEQSEWQAATGERVAGPPSQPRTTGGCLPLL